MWDLIPQHLTWIPQVKSTLLSIGLSSGKERERVRARSVRNVKEGALGWIPKSYPLCFSVDGGKKSRTTIGAEQTHRSRWAQWPRDRRQGSVSRGQGLGGAGRGQRWGVGGSWDMSLLQLRPCLLFWLLFWNCGCAEACSTATVNGTCWSALSFSVAQRASSTHTLTYAHAHTQRRGRTSTCCPKLCDDAVETAWAGQPNHNPHMYLGNPVDIYK